MKKSKSKTDTITRAESIELLTDHGIDLYAKRLFLIGEVNDTMYENVCRGLAVLNQAAGINRIEIVLNTCGGDSYASVAIYDAIKRNQIPVDILCQGTCMSAGTLILQAANTRRSDPHCQFMVHFGYEYFGGEVGTARRYMEHYKEFEKQICEIYIKRTGIKLPELKKLFDRDTFMPANKALEIGLIDAVCNGN